MADYARGLLIERRIPAPMMELALPDEVYQIATRSDLRDLRVFNADGAPAPHAFCAAPETTFAAVTEQSLPIFDLKDAARAAEGARVRVETVGGMRVNVEEDGSQAPTALDARTHIIDARGVEEPLRAILFDWASPEDGASHVKVRIEASEDLDVWENIVASSTLLRADQGGRMLRRERIALPPRPYQYLRVQRIDGGAPLILRSAVAERVAPAADIEPLSFLPNALASEEPNVLLFDTARVAPIRFARVRLAQDNSSMNVTLQSRVDDSSPWRERWSGETYVVVSDTDRRESPPARFGATTDRYWRILLPKEAEALPRPTVEFGYYPLRLRFLAQGTGPYTIAFGSRRAAPANPASCDGLLADVSAKQRRGLIAEGYPGDMKTLGGDSALKPPPKKTPTRLIVLWAVLIAGVGLLVAMALALLQRVRPAGANG
jgi:hypothetical protein